LTKSDKKLSELSSKHGSTGLTEHEGEYFHQ
jgi:hypothetical protein